MRYRRIAAGTSRLFSGRAARMALLAAASLGAAALLAAAASASVGVVSVSRGGGAPGDEIAIRLDCGFCYPPCEGPKGERHPAGFEHGPCMLGTDGAAPPRSFGISLVPLDQVPRPHRCGANALCTPQASAPPRRAPFRYLGLAVPPPQGNSPESGLPPRYLLEFEIPDVAPGLYTYVIYSDAARKGAGGSLIANPGAQLWRLRVVANRR